MGKAIRKRERSQAISKAMAEIGAKSVRVGWFETAKYPDGMPVAYVATIHEYGYGAIPPRPFMRPTIAAQTNKWSGLFAKGAKAIANGNITASAVMDQMGSLAASDVKDTIDSITAPPLKESTVKARERRYASKGGKSPTKPLMDTRDMIGSVTYEVGRDSGE